MDGRVGKFGQVVVVNCSGMEEKGLKMEKDDGELVGGDGSAMGGGQA